MRPASIALALVLSLPILASANLPVTETEAVAAVEQLVAEVGAYTAQHPDVPGGCAAWANGDISPEPPLLVHLYPTLEPSYYYVPLTSQRTGDATFVTVDASSGQWQAFGPRPARASFPEVSRAQAAQLAATSLGLSVAPADVRAVGMPDKHLYWHAGTPGGSEVFISLDDPSDVHDGLDECISPTRPSCEPPADAVERGGHSRASEPSEEDGPPRYPTSYDIADVPYHVQNNADNCGPAAAEMVLDYWGSDIDQDDVADVANCLSGSGSWNSDIRRTGHFSAISTAVQNASLHGYDERKLGYAALDQWWSLDTPSDPDYPDRYNDLKDLVSQDYPLLLLTLYNTGGCGHFRVVKGYNDDTNVFIVHDPWYSAPYHGPNVNFNQTFFVDTLWAGIACRWATLICPWEVQVSAPDEVDFGETFTVQAVIYYHGPHPFEGQDGASGREAVIDPSPLFTLAPGETATKAIAGTAPSGIGNFVSWNLVAPSAELGNVVTVTARGLISDSSTSYPSYSDSIGGWGSHPVTVVNESGIDDSVPGLLSLHRPHPSPFDDSTTLSLDLPSDAARVTLAIYNVRGQIVRTLADGPMSRGRREFVWKGEDDAGRSVSTGVYFARCECDAGTSAQSLVLVR